MDWRHAGRITTALAAMLVAAVAGAAAFGAARASAGTPVFSEVPGSPFAVGDAAAGPSSDADAFTPDGKYLVTVDDNYQDVTFTSNPEIDTVSVFGVTGGDSLTNASQLTIADGSPPTGHRPVALAIDPIAGGQDTVAVYECCSASGVKASIGMFSLDTSTGQLTQWSGSPFPAVDSGGQQITGSGLMGLAFSPDGSMLAVAPGNSGHVLVYKVDSADHTLSTQANLEETVGNATFSSVAWTPDGRYVAATDVNNQQLDVWPIDATSGFGQPTTQLASNMLPQTTVATVESVYGHSLLAFSDGNQVYLYEVNSDGTLTGANGSPFTPGNGVGVDGLAFNASGTMLAATAGQTDLKLSVMSVAPDGTLALVDGSPYQSGVHMYDGPNTAAFLPAGGLIATANDNDQGQDTGTVRMYAVAAPTATISSPADNQTFFQYVRVPTQFNCADGAGAPGIYYDGNSYGCQDSNNAIADHNTGSGTGALDTNNTGTNLPYTVTATSNDGQVSTKTIHYSVVVDDATVHLTATPAVVDASDGGSGSAVSSAPVQVQVSVTGSATPTGQVALVNGAGTTVATLTLDGSGDASKTLTGLAPDAGPLTAQYGGPNGPSATEPLRVGLDPVTVTLSQLPNVQTGAPVQLTGAIAASDAGDASPSGTVTVRDGAGGPALGTATLSGSPSGGSEPFSVTLHNGLAAGQHTLVADFSDVEDRFAAGSASEQVTSSVSTTCFTVQVQAVSVPTRVNGTLAYQNVPVAVAPQSDACGSGTGVTSGGHVQLTASPPAYEVVTGFTIATQDGGTSTVQVGGSPGAGQPAGATITVTGPVAVTPITAVVNPSACPSLSLASHWRGSATNQSALASFTVTGEVGCSVTAPSTTETVAAGSSIQALPGTPLQVTADSAEISSASGDDYIDALGGYPAGATVTGASASFELNSSVTVNAEARMVCTPLPAIVQSTGGAVAQLGEATIAASGTLSTMLTSDTANVRRIDLDNAACPPSWGSGVVPGASITYLATPTAYDKSLGLPASDPRSAWGVAGFHEADQVDDSTTTEAAGTLGSTSLTPDLIGSTVSSKPVAHVLVEPGGTGTAAESDHAVAVGFRFERLACVTVSTDVASYGRDTGGVMTLGEYRNGQPITPGGAAASLTIDTPPNCTALGGNYYKPGTQIQVTATDPANLGALSALTEEQHPGAYDGTTDPDYFAPPPSGSSAEVASAAELGPGDGDGDDNGSQPANGSRPPHKRPKRQHVRPPKRAPRHIPRHAPPAAIRVPTVRGARTGAKFSLAAGDATTERAQVRAERLSAAEVRARRAAERAERSGNVAKLARTSRAWGTAERDWWAAELAVISDRVTSEKTAMTQLTNVAAAQFGNGGAPPYVALQIVAAKLREQVLAIVAQSANDQARRLHQLLAATRIAASRSHQARLRQELTELVQIDKLVREHAAAQKRLLKADGRQLAMLVRRQTRAERAMVAQSMALLAAARRSSQHRTRGASARHRRSHGSPSRHHRARAASLAKLAQGVRPVALAADASSSRPLYPDETAAPGSPGFVKVPLTFQGTYADDTDGLLIQSGGDSHTATFTVGTSPMTVHATWGPSDCERPTILPYDHTQMTVSVDGGAGACAGPGTVARMGTFVVNADPQGAAVPVVVVNGIAPGGQPQERVQVGSSESFPALKDSTVHVQACEPLEFGGQVTDTVGGGTAPFDGSMIDQFASVVPGTGSECAVPGFYTIGSQIRFSLPSYLQAVTSWHTVVNPYAPAPPVTVRCATLPGDCTRQPPAGTADWEVDGTDAGPTPPTVTLDENQPQHEVGLSMTVKCDRLSIDVQSRYNEPGATFDTAPDCPVTYPDDGTTTNNPQGANLETVTVGHFLAGDVVQLSTDPNTGQDAWTNLPEQPSNSVYLNSNDTFGGGPFYVDFAGNFGDGASTVGADEKIQMQEGGGFAQYDSWPDWNIPTLTDLESEGATALTQYAVEFFPLLKAFYNELDTVFTTDPFSSLSSFETWAKSAGLLLLSAEDPQVGELMVDADYNGALDSPGDFATYLGQAGRFAAASGVQVAFTVAQTAGLSGAVQLGLALGDAAIVELSNGLTKIGAPSALVTAIRSARVLTNGINALKDCTVGAAAGNYPPTAPSTSGAAKSDTGSALATTFKSAYKGSNLNEPPPLKAAYNSFPAGGTLSDAGTVAADATRSAAENSKIGIALGELELAHTLPGPNYNWTASDYANCLAAETIG